MRKLGNFVATINSWYRSLSGMGKVAVVMAAVLLVTAGGVGATAWWYFFRLSDMGKMFPELEWPGQDIPDVGQVFEGPVLNILLMGFDRNRARDEKYDYYRPDTLMVAAINLKTGKVDLVSIPRDTVVPLPHAPGGRGRINTSYYYGWSSRYSGLTDPEERHQSGLHAVMDSVSQVLQGIPIHHYVAVDMDGAAEIVDTLGGVWYDVEHDVYSPRGELWLKAGYQQLNGRQFLYYVRNRKYWEGDFRRVENQQNILIAAFEQFKAKGKLGDARQIYTSIRNHLETSLTLEQIAALGLFASQHVDSDNISTHTLPGGSYAGRLHAGQTVTGYYVLVDQEGRADLLKEVWGLVVTPGPRETILPPLPGEEPDPDSNHHDPDQETGADAEEEQQADDPRQDEQQQDEQQNEENDPEGDKEGDVGQQDKGEEDEPGQGVGEPDGEEDNGGNNGENDQ